jgi:hypothetical protein
VVTHLQIHHEAIQLPGLEKGEHGLESDISKLFFSSSLTARHK